MARVHKLFRLLGNRNYWPALRQGVAASVEHNRIPLRTDIRTVLDVGASRGQFALFAEQRFPAAKIVSFEPLPAALVDLRSIVGPRVEVHEAAIGAKAGTATINVSAATTPLRCCRSAERQVKEFPGTAVVDSIEVRVSTLDEILESPPARPCLLKIDVQGLELDVLKGAARTLESVDEALIECSFVELYEGQPMADEIVLQMLEAGLRLAGVYETVYSADGSAVQADFLFRRD